MTLVDLAQLFEELNQAHFGGVLERPVLRWNSRLRASAGRFFPGRRAWSVWGKLSCVIEVATYLREELEAEKRIRDTLAHEMIHFWLWSRRRPYGHTPEFIQKMKELGVSRYNPVPRLRPHRYVYECPGCKKQFRARKRLGTRACAECCERHAQGRFDARFELVITAEAGISSPPGR